MSKWTLSFLPEAVNDLKKLDKGVRNRVAKTIERVLENPLPDYEGGYGKPLENKGDIELAGLCKIKLRSCGVRVVYKVVSVGSEMTVIVVGMREDSEVYREAIKRKLKYGL